MKNRGTIGFQADGATMEQIAELADTLKVDKSVIARNAYSKGLILAVEALKAERVRSAEAEKQRLSALEPRALYAFNFTNAVLRSSGDCLMLKAQV